MLIFKVARGNFQNAKANACYCNSYSAKRCTLKYLWSGLNEPSYFSILSFSILFSLKEYIFLPLFFSVVSSSSLPHKNYEKCLQNSKGYINNS